MASAMVGPSGGLVGPGGGLVGPGGGAGSFAVNAVLFRTQDTNSFALDAEISQGYFSVDAFIILGSVAGTPFPLDAVRLASVPGSTTADAILRKTIPGSTTLDAIIKKTSTLYGVDVLRPVSDVVKSGTIGYTSGTDGWALVDEVSLNTSDNYTIQGASSYLINGFPSSNARGDATVSSVVIHIDVANGAPAATCQLQMRNPDTGTRYNIYAIGQNPTPNNPDVTRTTRPWDSQPFTARDVNQLQIGFNGSTNGTFVARWLYATVTWSGPPTFSVDAVILKTGLPGSLTASAIQLKTMTGAAPPPAAVNWATPANGASATASSSWQTWTPDKAIDSNDADPSGWASNLNYIPGEWLKVDLGQERSVAAARIYSVTWENNAFYIQYSTNGTDWTSVNASMGPFWRNHTLDVKVNFSTSITARYWRIYYFAGNAGCEVRSFELLSAPYPRSGAANFAKPTTGAYIESTNGIWANLYAYYAVDDDDSTFWVPNINDLSGGTTWLRVLLPVPKTVTSIRVYRSYYTNGYNVEYWDGDSWEIAFSRSGAADDHTETLGSPITAQDWRLRFTSGSSGTEVRQFELWGSEDTPLTLDAYVVRSGTFSVDAAIVVNRTGSFTADAVRFAPDRPGSLTSDATLLRLDQPGSLTADAVIRATSSSATQADAWLSGIFTLDAWKYSDVGEHTGSFLADAALRKEGVGAFAADAILHQAQQGALAVDAILFKVVAAGLTADAAVWKTLTSSTTVDAVIHKAQAGSFLADAVLRKPQSGDTTASAWLSGTFTLSAVIHKAQAGAFTADAEISQGYFSVDAFIGRTFAIDAVLRKAEGGVLTLDAVLTKTVNGWIDTVQAGGQPLIWSSFDEFSGVVRNHGSHALEFLAGSGTSYRTSTPYGYGMTFNASDYIQSKSAYTVALGNTLTIEAWVKPTDTSNQKTILGNNNTANVPSMRILTGSALYLAIMTGTSTVVVQTSTGLTINQWHHIVYTRSGTGSGTHKVYVNGVQRSLSTAGSSNYADASTYWFLGRNAASGSTYFYGDIKDVVVYGRALSQTEILAHYRRSYQPALADAVIFKTQLKTLSVNAEIVPLRFWASAFVQPYFLVDAVKDFAWHPFTLDAWKTGFHVNAVIVPLRATLDAFIALLVFEDDFNRTVSTLWGRQYGVGGRSRRDDYVESNPPYVDGSTGVVPMDTWFDYVIGYAQVSAGYVQFDVLSPTDPVNDRWNYFQVDGRREDGTFEQWEPWVAANGDGTWELAIYPGSLDVNTPTIEASTWYRIKFFADTTLGGGGNQGVKFWKVSDPEPDVWLDTGVHGTSFGTGWDSVMHWDPWWYSDLHIDNLKIWATRTPWTFAGALTLVDAVIWASGTQTRSFTFAALALAPRSGTATLDAVIVYKRIWASAVLRRQTRAPFIIDALIARNAFTVDAVFAPGGALTLAAWLLGIRSATLSLDAFIFDGTTRVRSRTIDATLKRNQATSKTLNAVIVRLVTQGSGSFTVDVLQLAPGDGGSLTLDASIHSGVWAWATTLDADIRGQGEQRAALSIDGILGRQSRGIFLLEGRLERLEIIRLDALIGGGLFIDAVLRQPLTILLDARLSGRMSVDANIRGTRSGTTTLNAVKASTSGAFPDHRGSFVLDALVLADRSSTPIWTDAVVALPATTETFTIDAFVGTTFVASAWIARTDGGLYGGMFGAHAFIRGNTTIIWPSDGGPATDPNGDPLPDWFKASRKYRISITVDGTDVTGDVIWSRTTFTQNAKTNPGTFELTLKGISDFDGGEEVLVTIDDLRVFGGYALQVERTYAFTADADEPLTTLHGADFNILFDKLIVYNKASVPDGSGKYTNWKAFKKGTLDTTIIDKVFSSYVDLPPGFDYTTYVETVDTPAPEKPWVMPEAGSPLRQVMQSISQVTEAVWWIDPYMNLHYNSRYVVTAPFPITDGLGGISSQQIAMSEDISQLVTETLVWGTLSYTVEGDIRTAHRYSSEYTTMGPWQSAEFRSDLHHTAYINRRADSIIDRYGQPIKRATVTIFEPGYQAGQVADVRLTNHGLEAVLVIRSLTLQMAVSNGLRDGFYYAVPRYELQVGLDPEEPWDIYDYLPFQDWRIPWRPGFKRDRWEEQDCEDAVTDDGSGAGGSGFCGACSGDVVIFSDDFNRIVTGGNGSSRSWGTSSNGMPWYVYQPFFNNATTTVSVDGSAGVIAWPVPGQTGGASLMYTDVLPGLEAGSFTITTRISGWTPANEAVVLIVDKDIPTHIPYSDDLDHYVGFGNSNSGPNAVYLDIQDGAAYGYAYISSPVSGTYNLKWERSAGAYSRMRIWADGTAEPATWNVQIGIQETTLPGARLGVEATNRTKQFDYIDVQLSDSCYFDISTADAVFSSTTYPAVGDAWGPDWQTRAYRLHLGGTATGYNYNTEVGVEGGLGYLRLYEDTVINSMANVRTSQQSVGPWNGGEGFVVNIKFKYDGRTNPDWTVGILGANNNFDRWIFYNDGAWDYQSNGESPGTDFAYYPFGQLQEDTWYHLRWEYRPTLTARQVSYPSFGINRIKVWPHGYPEPADWLIESPNAGIFLEPGNYIYSSITSWGSGPAADYGPQPSFSNQVRTNVYFQYFDICDNATWAADQCAFDTFTRTVASGWGTADSGDVWEFINAVGTNAASVDGTSGRIVVLGSGATSANCRIFDLPVALPVEYTLLMDATWIDAASGDLIRIRVGQDTSAEIALVQNGEFAYAGQSYIFTSNFGDEVVDTGHDFSAPFYVKIRLEATRLSAKTWLASGAEPTSWDVTTTATGIPESTAMLLIGLASASGSAEGMTLSVSDIAISCQEVTPTIFDSFTRTVSGGWGTADHGNQWLVSWSGNASAANANVNGSTGTLETFFDTGTTSVDALIDDLAMYLPWTVTFDYVVGPDDPGAHASFSIGSFGAYPPYFSFHFNIYTNDNESNGYRSWLETQTNALDGSTNPATFRGYRDLGPSLGGTSGTMTVTADAYGVTLQAGGHTWYQLWRDALTPGSPDYYDHPAMVVPLSTSFQTMEFWVWHIQGLTIDNIKIYDGSGTYGSQHPSYSGSAVISGGGGSVTADCADPTGEVFGAVTEGWGCETIYVKNGVFTTTGLVTTGTLRVYDADTGEYLYQNDDWHDYDGDGKDFTVSKAGVERVIACYRNHVENIGSRMASTRQVDPSVSILGERHIPI